MLPWLLLLSANSIVQIWQYEMPGQMFNELRYDGYLDYYLYPAIPISENSTFVPICQYLLYHEKWQFGFCDDASLILVAPEIPVTGALPHDTLLLIETVNQEIVRGIGENSKLLQIAHKNVEELLFNENEIHKTLYIP